MGKCEVCQVETPLRCSACKKQYYCGKDHQRQRWHECHSLLCHMWASLGLPPQRPYFESDGDDFYLVVPGGCGWRPDPLFQLDFDGDELCDFSAAEFSPLKEYLEQRGQGYIRRLCSGTLQSLC
jgi:hypothetical protein